MSISLTEANDYFNTHVQGDAWEGFSVGQRNRAILHAKRQVSERLGDDFTDTSTVDGEMPRHDLACYEQAFYLLRASDLPRDGDTGAPRYLDNDGEQYEGGGGWQSICKAANSYITGYIGFPGVELRRG